jgi:type I pantothenate kinase
VQYDDLVAAFTSDPLMSSSIAALPIAADWLSPASYDRFDRASWARLREATPLTLDEADLVRLRGINEAISLDEVEAIYLPLSRLLNLHVSAIQDLQRVKESFLGQTARPSTYIIGIAGSVAVGKSTTARILQALLSRWPNHPKVDLVTTDGFLLPNAVLEARGLMRRKGFPESYDTKRLLEFVSRLKAGARRLAVPTYSHQTYDIVPGGNQVVDRPDILILEGLNVLQGGEGHPAKPSRLFVSDFFDFSLYVDAEEAQLESWYLERFARLRETAFNDPRAYFRFYAEMPKEQALARAREIWRDINLENLRQNIAPTRGRANLVLRKGRRHSVDEVWLRKS